MVNQHLFDRIAESIDRFDLHNPRASCANGLCLRFEAPLSEPRRVQIEDVLIRTAASGAVMVGLGFWLPQHRRFRDPIEALSLLSTHGLGKAEEWECRSQSSLEQDSPSCEVWSQEINLSAEAARLLSELIVRTDHGTWERIAACVYVCPSDGALLRFWDDRGADVLSRDAASCKVYERMLGSYVDATLTSEVWSRGPR